MIRNNKISNFIKNIIKCLNSPSFIFLSLFFIIFIKFSIYAAEKSYNQYLIKINDSTYIDTLKIFNQSIFIYQPEKEKIKRDSINRKEIEKEKLLDSLKEIKKDLYKEVKFYIKKYVPKSKMNAESIVDACLFYDYDIPLLLSQAYNESHLGTSSKNVFGIKRKKKYSHPDKAIVDYIKLMQSKYIKTRTVEEALAAGLNVEGSKNRYATAKDYPKKIKKTRSNIKNKTNIDSLSYLFKDLKQQIYEK